ncbi:MAG: TlpA family protein disulfide reductase [Gammaproteobacteria bacterium]|nr:TlpA family protein disulfide reductase [Gammaproteobacteria bacterium]
MKVSGTLFIWLLVIAFFVFMAWPALQELGGQGMSVGDEFPALELEDVTGKTLEFPADQIVVLNVWATWCAPCRAELPMLQSVGQAWERRGVQVVLANEEVTARTRVNDYLHSRNILLRSGFLPALQARRIGGIGVVPTTFIIDREGRLAVRFNRAITQGELERELERLLVKDANLK